MTKNWQSNKQCDDHNGSAGGMGQPS